MSYRPIESYGVIGDMHSVALVGMDGSIDWCCLPHFDSPSVFAALLDYAKGGRFRIAPRFEARAKQMYLPETNVLVTRFLGSGGVAEIVDCMPIEDASTPARHQIVRLARCVRGSVRLEMECRPAFDYARQPHEAAFEEEHVLFRSRDFRLVLAGPAGMTLADGAARLDFELKEGAEAAFVLEEYRGDRPELPAAIDRYSNDAVTRTVQVWRAWAERCRYRGRWREMVVRSALALKLLTFQPTGAMVAAATCSLPEQIGGVRNWDYRYTWIRDSAFMLYAFLKLGYDEEAAHFFEWLEARAREGGPTGPLQIMYGIDGRHQLPEFELDHLEGYRGSRPVRIGNAAYDQFQLDIYGELIDAVYLYNKYGRPISWDLWTCIRSMLYWVCENWQRPDYGIWEIRGGARHFVYSKLQCWVALNRGLRIAAKRGLPLDVPRVQRAADEIHEAIQRDGWNPARNSYVQFFGSDALDANLLMMPLMLFNSPTDPRMAATLDRIGQDLVSDNLVSRYVIGHAADDGLPGDEGTFSICTFWLVEVLSRAGRLDEARLVFEKMLTYANHLGLYAEEIGLNGEQLGNYPQAFTHLGLIGAALDLDRALDGGAHAS